MSMPRPFGRSIVAGKDNHRSQLTARPEPVAPAAPVAEPPPAQAEPGRRVRRTKGGKAVQQRGLFDEEAPDGGT